MADAYATSFATPNYSGLLFNKGNTETPFTTLIGSRLKTTDHVEFVTGQEYNTDFTPAQPSISETASLTAPDCSVATRSQKTNVTQIFMDSVGISDAKLSNMGTLSGVNIAGQKATPVSELDFQTGIMLNRVAQKIEYTLINGTYQKATKDSEANKTRGMISAITTNTIACASKPLTWELISQMTKKIRDANAPTDNLTLIVDGVTMLELNDDARINGMSPSPASRDTNGINMKEFITPFGTVGVMLGKYLPAGTALLVNDSVISLVEQPVPGKGNFYREELAKTGAGSKYQLFGQLGLDHGPEWYHGKFTGIATTRTAPEYSAIVKTVSDTTPA